MGEEEVAPTRVDQAIIWERIQQGRDAIASAMGWVASIFAQVMTSMKLRQGGAREEEACEGQPCGRTGRGRNSDMRRRRQLWVWKEQNRGKGGEVRGVCG